MRHCVARLLKLVRVTQILDVNNIICKLEESIERIRVIMDMAIVFWKVNFGITKST